jgi:hypothetical protein
VVGSFPGDWVLLRDATRTPMQAVILIHKQGPKLRTGPPETLIREMNRLVSKWRASAKRKPHGKCASRFSGA